MSDFKPAGWPTVAVRIFTDDGEALVGFLRSVFDARGDYHAERPAEMWLGDSVVMVSGGGGVRDAMAACLYVYVADADATYRRALDAGAESLEAPMDLPYGDRRAMVRDPWGNFWQIATRRAVQRR